MIFILYDLRNLSRMKFIKMFNIALQYQAGVWKKSILFSIQIRIDVFAISFIGDMHFVFLILSFYSKGLEQFDKIDWNEEV